VASPRLSVVQLLPALESGGVEQGTLEVAAELVRGGHRSIVLSAGGRMVKPLLAAGSEHYNWSIGAKNPLTLRYIFALRHLLQRQRVTLLHARSRLPAWIAYLAWRSLPPSQRPRFITTAHGLYSVKYYSAIMARGERVIAVSDTVRRYLLDHYPHSCADRIVTIYRGVDPLRYFPGLRPSEQWYREWYQQFPQTQGKRWLLLPGRLTRLKGHLDFLQLVAQLCRHHPDLHALIVGGEDPKRRAYAQALYRQVAAQGLGQQLTFTGVRDDLREIMASSHLVYSLSSHPESFGRTTLEALSLGIPVVGYDHGGVGEILAQLLPEGRTPPHAVAAALQKSLELLANPPRPRPNTLYTSEQMLKNTLRLYQELATL